MTLRVGAAERCVRAAERFFDAVFGLAANPLRQLGALAFWLLWIVVASGFWVYALYDTSVADAWTSVQAMTEEQPLSAGLMRSLHRYASDGFVLVSLAHLLREALLGRFRRFRWFSWASGVPLLWLTTVSGLVGYWMVWDERALYIGSAALEWTAALPGVDFGVVRNFLDADAITDRFFSLLAFLHIGVPLLLLLGLWVHLLRLARPQTQPQRALAAGTLATLVIGSLAWPATSQPVADLARVPAAVPIDWFYLAALPAADHLPLVSWLVLLGATAVLLALPWWPTLRSAAPASPAAETGAERTAGLAVAPRRVPTTEPAVVPRSAPALSRGVALVPGAAAAGAAAVVDPAHCNGCTLCLADCPYNAITMVPHRDARIGARMARVDAALCAACGICAGACPSATPFRRGEVFATGIDLPQRPLQALRTQLDAALERLAQAAAPRLVVLGCECGAVLGANAADPATVMLSAACTAQWPPAFIEYALRRGADGVLLTGCPGSDCRFRLGARWSAERLAGTRLPHLRAQTPRERVRLHAALREDTASLRRAVADFRAALAAADQLSDTDVSALSLETDDA